jgi:hypothetical protein
MKTDRILTTQVFELRYEIPRREIVQEIAGTDERWTGFADLANKPWGQLHRKLNLSKRYPSSGILPALTK